MNLELKPRENCRFDAVSLGEIMLRFDPGEGRIRTARNFRVWEGGGEYNVVRGLHKCFGLKTAVITAFADNEVGKLLIDFIEQGGVATDFIRMVKTLPQRTQLYGARFRCARCNRLLGSREYGNFADAPGGF